MPLVDDIINQILTDLRQEFLVETFIEVEYGQKFDEPDMDVRIRLGGETDPDTINKTNMTEFGPLGGPTHEIGGGLWWRRHFYIEVAFFIDIEERNDARSQALEYQSRIISCINQLAVTSSDTRELFIQAVPQKAYLNDVADGPFIWRGKIHFTTMTYFIGRN